MNELKHEPHETVSTTPPGKPAGLQRLITPRTRAWLELFRLPNVFTAVADPLAGALAAGARWSDALQVLLVTTASACLYTFGMVLNDWNDYRKDLRERPHRPLPSKRIARWKALVAAMLLMLVGAGLASLAGSGAMAVAVLLIASIVIYDVDPDDRIIRVSKTRR